MSINIRPLRDRVVIKRVEEERTSPGGIVIPDTASGEKPSQGEVVAVGPGKVLDNGEIRALALSVGDKVLFGKYAGTEVKISDQEMLVMNEDDVMGIIEA